MAQPDKSIAISPMPMPKLTAVLNDFIAKTVNHLNKLSVNVESQLQNFDQKLNDLETMTTLLEAKLNSLPPDITATYPQLVQCSLDDVNPVVSVVQPVVSNNNPSVPSVPSVPSAPSGSVPVPPPMNAKPGEFKGPGPVQPQPQNPEGGEEEKKEEEPKPEAEMTPQEKLDKFLEENKGSFVNLHKMLKMQIPDDAVRQKAMMNGIDADKVDELISLYRAVHPN